MARSRSRPRDEKRRSAGAQGVEKGGSNEEYGAKDRKRSRARDTENRDRQRIARDRSRDRGGDKLEKSTGGTKKDPVVLVEKKEGKSHTDGSSDTKAPPGDKNKETESENKDKKEEKQPKEEKEMKINIKVVDKTEEKKDERNKSRERRRSRERRSRERAWDRRRGGRRSRGRRSMERQIDKEARRRSEAREEERRNRQSHERRYGYGGGSPAREGSRRRSRDRKRDESEERRREERRRERSEERKAQGKWDSSKPDAANLTREQVRGMTNDIPRYTEKELLERTLIIGKTPPGVGNQDLIDFFNGAVLAMTGNPMEMATAKMKPVFGIAPTDGGKKRLLFRSFKGTVIGMQLNGIEYRRAHLEISRPTQYKGSDGSEVEINKISLSDLLGLNEERESQESAMRSLLNQVSGRLSVTNIPPFMSEKACRDLFSQFGGLKMVSIMMDSKGENKGYGFFEYDRLEHADVAKKCLNGFVVGDRALAVTRLNDTVVSQAGIDQELEQMANPHLVERRERDRENGQARLISHKILANPVLALQVRDALHLGRRPSKVVQLLNAVYESDIMDPMELEDVRLEILSEAEKFGTVVDIKIPRPSKIGAEVPGVGKIFVQFQDTTAARRFQVEVNGRKFNDRSICASFYPYERYIKGRFILNEERGALFV
ncbi:unnamed protein product [Amoebophrya sp. A25]|nr:unnamed protein product [Amoebophrya sp. A25]|eukprot:GSA25T00025555001.1